MGGSLTGPNKIKDVYTKLVFYDNGTLKYDNGSADVNITSASGLETDFTTTGDSGSTTISSSDTLTLTGGTGIATTVSGDTVTFNVESAVLLESENIDGGDYTP